MQQIRILICAFESSCYFTRTYAESIAFFFIRHKSRKSLIKRSMNQAITSMCRNFSRNDNQCGCICFASLEVVLATEYCNTSIHIPGEEGWPNIARIRQQPGLPQVTIFGTLAIVASLKDCSSKIPLYMFFNVCNFRRSWQHHMFERGETMSKPGGKSARQRRMPEGRLPSTRGCLWEHERRVRVVEAATTAHLSSDLATDFGILQ